MDISVMCVFCSSLWRVVLVVRDLMRFSIVGNFSVAFGSLLAPPEKERNASERK
jgi:hypothetical protein